MTLRRGSKIVRRDNGDDFVAVQHPTPTPIRGRSGARKPDSQYNALLRQ